MMITYADIKKAVNDNLKTLGIEINSRDVTEGFNRPSFFVQLENNIRSGSETQVQKTMTIQIYYFPSDRYDYSIDVLTKQEQLENLFYLKLKVKDRFLNIFETTSDLVDGVLNFSFDIDFYDMRKVSYGSLFCYIDEKRNYILDADGRLITDETKIPNVVSGYTPIEVTTDENGNPITDPSGNPIPIEYMKILDIKR